MPCFSPLPGFKGPVNENGKRPVIWRAPAGSEKQPVPCGKCIGCRLRYSKNWAIRCMHESQMHTENSFITLTYDEKNVPADGNLDVREVQLFMKRLRKKIGQPVRYFFAGEYGGRFGRPHYHGLMFGYDFPDKVLKVERLGNKLYESKILAEVWPNGFHTIGDLSYASAAYVARYCVKKATAQVEYYRDDESGVRMQVDKRSGHIRSAEFTVMSRKPGIGAKWFERFNGDVFPSDEVIINGRKERPPRFYDNLLDKKDPDLLENLKVKRASGIKWSENTLERLLVREQFQLDRMKHLIRPLEVK